MRFSIAELTDMAQARGLSVAGMPSKGPKYLAGLGAPQRQRTTFAFLDSIIVVRDA